jgi:hypothetical protein
MRRVRLFATLVALHASALSALEAKTPRNTAHRQSRADPLANAAAAIFLNSASREGNLQRACSRSDFKLLALGLEGIHSRINHTKGEFETEAEFADRTHKIENILNGANPIIICQSLDDNSDAPFEYDADHELFKGSFATHQNVWRDVKRLGSYVSHTKMGVRAKVTSSLEMEYNVDMGDSLRAVGRTCGKSDYLGYAYEVPVPRTAAPLLKARGYLVFLGRLVSPFVETGDTPGSPTLDDPEDIYERDYTVHFAASEVAIVGLDGARIWDCRLDLPEPQSKSVASIESPTRSNGVWLQLASGQTADALPAQFERLRSRNRDLFDGIHAYIAKSADRARLVIGPFRGQADAQIFAEDLQTAGIDAFTWTSSEADTLIPLAK